MFYSKLKLCRLYTKGWQPFKDMYTNYPPAFSLEFSDLKGLVRRIEVSFLM